MYVTGNIQVINIKIKVKLYIVQKIKQIVYNIHQHSNKKHILLSKLLEENSDKPRKFRQTIKNIMPCKSKGTSCRSHFLEDSCVKADTPVQKSNLLSNFFSNVAMTLKKKSIFMKDLIWRQPNKSFVEKELKNLKRHKATGIDNLPPALIKDSANEISQPLCFIINLSLSTADVPTEWKHATVTPKHKLGPSTKVDNYRPISILPIASKILERAVRVLS
ncbi:uncharacterized protein LOC130612869 [Hydractinia symbiolongicarpus]|uniref:uncharacterized protein LOC130612869 n=1 Tax=Hydractinia symbiolongicarpus TaxID=13093 RepID=UPI00254CE841|nr:uncharacterized protein LOC130612869 [Hydractinia symbiolongicarpus]